MAERAAGVTGRVRRRNDWKQVGDRFARGAGFWGGSYYGGKSRCCGKGASQQDTETAARSWDNTSAAERRETERDASIAWGGVANVFLQQVHKFVICPAGRATKKANVASRLCGSRSVCFNFIFCGTETIPLPFWLCSGRRPTLCGRCQPVVYGEYGACLDGVTLVRI